MKEYRFNVFGMPMAITGVPGQWQAFRLGPDGKRRPAGIIVPADVQAHELGEYLADLYHEHARPKNHVVVPLEDER